MIDKLKCYGNLYNSYAAMTHFRPKSLASCPLVVEG